MDNINQFDSRVCEALTAIAAAGCQVEHLALTDAGELWGVVRSTDTGRLYRWPGMFAWRKPLPGEPPRNPGGPPGQSRPSPPSPRRVQQSLF